MTVRVSSQRREISILGVVIVADIIVLSFLVADVFSENIAQSVRVGLGFDLICLSPKIRFGGWLQ